MSTRATRDSLIDACRREPVTLFVGAGISHSRGVPLWNEVVRRMAEWVTGNDEDETLLGAVREAVRERLGDEVSARVVLRTHPLEPQLALEWVEAQLADPEVRAEVARRIGADDASFVSLLRRALYEQVDTRGAMDDALSAVGEAVRSEFEAWPDRQLLRIVTLNADDLLERTACADGVARLAPIARPSQSPRRNGTEAPPPIPVYHVHGYLPEDPDDPDGSSHTLVFTDDQFWSTTASPLSFANRVVANALHDSQCVFAGISMRDVNLMRWLAVRYEEVASDARRHGRGTGDEALRKHFWIHTPDTDPTGILTEILRRRGVWSVEIPSWEGDAFATLLRECFSRSARPATG